jgi:hypothetical protein
MIKRILNLVPGTGRSLARAPEPTSRPATPSVTYERRARGPGRLEAIRAPVSHTAEDGYATVENDADYNARVIAERAALRPAVSEKEGYVPIDSSLENRKDILAARMLGERKLMNGYSVEAYIEAAGGAVLMGDLKDAGFGDEMGKVRELVKSGKLGFIGVTDGRSLEEITADYRRCYDSESADRTGEELERMAAYKENLATGLIYMKGNKGLDFKTKRTINRLNIQKGYGIKYNTITGLTNALMKEEGKEKRHALGTVLATLADGVKKGIIVKARADDVIEDAGEKTTFRELFGIDESETIYFPYVNKQGLGDANTRAILQGLGRIPGTGPLVH